MIFPPVSQQEIRAAQAFTMGMFALWLVVGYVPSVRRHVTRIRLFLLAAYIVGCVGFVAYALLG